MSHKGDIKIALYQNTLVGQRPNGIQNLNLLTILTDFAYFLYVKNHIAEHRRLSPSAKTNSVGRTNLDKTPRNR